MKNLAIFDLEADALLDDVTMIHCLCYHIIETGETGEFTGYNDMRVFMRRKDLIFIGHNIVNYDIPVEEKILKIKVEAPLIDTLPIAQVIDTQKSKHGLAVYGEEYGIAKPVVEDWVELSVEEYLHRCREDVKINVELWKRQYRYLKQLYSSDEEIFRYLRYLTFKMDCVAEQEGIGIGLNVPKAQHFFDELSRLKMDKKLELEKNMPQVPVVQKKKIPKVLYKKDGSLSSNGEAWVALLEKLRIEPGTTSEVKVIAGYKAPNADSPAQLKNWLYSLGWVPQHIQHKRNKKTGKTKQIPQIKSEFEAGEVCNSVKKLFEKEPKLELLSGYTILTHRRNLFKGFLEDHKNGRLYPSSGGLTNTLRLQHRVIVNLPAPGKAYGEEIRSCLVADEGMTLCGCDLKGIEDNTKRHYIYPYDPKYVEDMNTPGYDAHLEIALLAGFMTQEEVDFYKEIERKKDEDMHYEPAKIDKERHGKLKPIRTKSKITNFSATYKVGAESLARNAGITLREAKKLLGIYWERNKAILEVENSLEVKEVYGQKWLFNPVSKFWYSLRAEKDRFSTLNQGTAVYVFDIWLTFIRKQGIKIPFQYHDEIAFNTNNKQASMDIVQKAMKLTNEKLQLNVKIGCSVGFGENYSLIH